MTELPFDLFEKIADMADIDARRHMGFPPRKLCTHRLKAAEDMLGRRSAMQHHYLQVIGETLVYVCSTVISITNKKLLHISYSVVFNRTYLFLMTIENFDASTINQDELIWRGQLIDNAIYIMHPNTPNQDVDIVSCHGICCKVAPTTLDIIRPLL
jgi:hypothetical protein